ncbi:MAG TPA: serine/threonine-protein kinase [Anaeromyxobacter sp.]
MISVGADVIVEVALRHERSERARIVRELCRGDAELEALALALLAGLDRPEAPLPSGPFPVELGPFTLERELGAGAHGRVYLARRRPLDGYVAVKLLRPGPGMSTFVEQVRREAGRARRIPSAHVVPVFDAGRIENGPFYVEMAVCADPDEASPGSIRIGRSLHDEGPGVSPAQAARLVEDLAGAVHAAHRTGVVHGDLKPENVLVTPETRRVMLADFGLATSLAQVAAPGSTPVGTIAYMAPEQWRDRLQPSESSDVYGLGGTLYFLLAGAPPHPGRERGEDAPLAPLPPTVPQRLREIVLRALSPDPADRPSTAWAFADELRRYRENDPTWHDRRSVARRFLLFGRRHAREAAAVGVVLAILLPLGMGGYHVFTGQVFELSRREARLRVQIDELERARRELERETARLEGEAGAKQQELARTEARLKLLPKMDQALGAARAQAEGAEQDAKARQESERRALDRVAALEAALAAGKDVLAQATAREASAVRDAGRTAGEVAELRARLASAVAEGEAARREAEERRSALEAELRERTAQLAASRAAKPGGESAGTAFAPVPVAGAGAPASSSRRKVSGAGGGGAGSADAAQEPRRAPELIQPARP